MIKRFEELQIVERLDLTHSGSTEIYLVRHEDRLYVCKVAQPQFR